MSVCRNYFLAESIESAFQASGENKNTRFIAGGTDLLLEIQQGRVPVQDILIDISRIPEFGGIQIVGENVFVGSTIPLAKIASSPLVKLNATALADACGMIGGPQVRNMATLGGNVAHALPAADGSIALVALDAKVVIVSPNTNHIMPILNLFIGPGVSALKPGREIIKGFLFTLGRSGQASAFARVMRPQGVALPVINMGIWLERKRDLIRNIRISIGPTGATPQRVFEVEGMLIGTRFTMKSLRDTCSYLEKTLNFRTSPHRATREYRQHLSGGLFEEVFKKAWDRAGELT
jgi:xanthine dehydrogenase FAD-binding subunit